MWQWLTSPWVWLAFGVIIFIWIITILIRWTDGDENEYF